MSRLTIREAVRVLQEHNVLRVEPGRGTYVNPRSQWTSLTDVIASLRLPTASWPEVCRNAIVEHRAVVATIVASSPDAAAAAMHSHVD